MEAILTSPSGKSEACEVRDTAGHVYDIRFVPAEQGLHAVSIKYKGIHIAGQSAPSGEYDWLISLSDGCNSQGRGQRLYRGGCTGGIIVWVVWGY